MREILVTGSAGFIGYAVCLEMGRHDWLVHPYDKTYVGYQDVTKADFRITLDKLARKAESLVVLHLAAEVGKLNCEINSTRALRVNVGGTLNVARACADYGVPLVYCSTSEVYGDHGVGWVGEHHALTNALTPIAPIDHKNLSGMYALTKFWGEMICQTYAPVDLKIIRPTMPYGPGVPPGPGRRALDNLVHQALTGQPMVVHRGAARSWCWIDDLASGFRAVIEDGGPGVYNVGRDDDEISMDELAWRISAMINDQALRLSQLGPGDPMIEAKQIQIIDPPARQTVVKRISCAKLRALGWEPKVSLDDGLPQMVAWIRDWLIDQHESLPPDNRATYFKRPER